MIYFSETQYLNGLTNIRRVLGTFLIESELQLVRLLKILCDEEKYASKNSEDIEIETTENTKAGDGGEDCLVKITRDRSLSKRFPRSKNLYQCKAGSFTQGNCEKEVLNKDGTIKSRILETLNEEGAYYIFNNQDIPAKNKQERVESIKKGLRKGGFKELDKVIIQFLSCNDLADWTNQYLSAVRYVASLTGAH